ncbi:MAG: GNAT family N-acetyltransferase [Acidimicrobiales bacterium]
MAGAPRLRPLRPEDEAAALAAHEEMAREEFEFLLGYASGEPWVDYLARLDRHSRDVDVPPGWVPGALLAAVVDGAVVGRLSVRYMLNDYLATVGGHIGYGVLPGHRRRGYATEMLRQGIVVARAHGVDDVLVTCDDDNVGSIRTIESCGGVFENLFCEPGALVATRRYWIR